MAGNNNQLSRYGAVGRNIPVAGPQGKYFFVGLATAAYYASLGFDYPVDNDGQVRVFPTITTALAACVSGRGDVILVLPGVAESVSAAAGIAISKTCVTIVGLGNGAQRPTITFDTATTATLTITGADVTIDNFRFIVGFDAVVSPIVISAAGVTIKNSYFMLADATYQATQGILTTAAANNLVIANNRFIGTVDAGTAAAITIVGGDGISIVDNFITGAYTTTVGGIQCITTLTTNIEIARNIIINRTASSAKAITLLTGSTGMIANNRLGILTGTVPIASDAAYWSGNYYAAAVATAGTLV